jgi:hypothetical protein
VSVYTGNKIKPQWPKIFRWNLWCGRNDAAINPLKSQQPITKLRTARTIRGREMLEKIETGERQSADAAAGSDERQLHVLFKDFQHTSPQPKPAGALHEVLAQIGRHLNDESLAIKTINDRLLAIEHQTKKRGSGKFTRYLIAICIGAAVVLAWQSYGEAAKHMIATKAPELGWSPQTKQMIANLVQLLGWTMPPADAESGAVRSSAMETPQPTPVAQTAPAAVAPSAPIAPSIDPEQVHQMALDLGALRESVQQLAARQVSLAALGQIVDQLTDSQDKIGRNIDRLQGSVAEILAKMPESPQPPPIAAAPAVAGRPAPGGAPPSENTQNTAPTSASLPVGHDATEGALRASCGPDVQKLCGGISRENGGVIKCLSSHRMELSPTCGAYFNKMPVHRADAEGHKPRPVTPPSAPPYIPPHP